MGRRELREGWRERKEGGVQRSVRDLPIAGRGIAATLVGPARTAASGIVPGVRPLLAEQQRQSLPRAAAEEAGEVAGGGGGTGRAVDEVEAAPSHRAVPLGGAGREDSQGAAAELGSADVQRHRLAVRESQRRRRRRRASPTRTHRRRGARARSAAAPPSRPRRRAAPATAGRSAWPSCRAARWTTCRTGGCTGATPW